VIQVISIVVRGGTVLIIGDKTRSGWRKLEAAIPHYYSHKRVAKVLREMADKLEKR